MEHAQRVAIAITGNSTDGEDAVQNYALNTLRRQRRHVRSSFKDEEHERNALRRAITNEVISIGRERQRHHASTNVEDWQLERESENNAFMGLNRAEQEQLAEVIIASLESEEDRILLKSHLLGYSSVEISRAISHSFSSRTVSNRLTRIFAHLRLRFGEAANGQT